MMTIMRIVFTVAAKRNKRNLYEIQSNQKKDEPHKKNWGRFQIYPTRK